MTVDHIVYAFLIWMFLTSIVYTFTGWQQVIKCYRMWFDKKYWTNYNIIEAASWLAKASIIVPGLIFGIQVWQLYFVALATSMTLIWASNKKLLPTLVGFNTLWIWLSCMVLIQNLL
jgi:hypothetical protein